MRTKTKNKLEKQLARRFITRYLIKIAIFNIVEVGFFATLYWSMNMISWQQDSFMQNHLSSISDAILIALAVTWVSGFFTITIKDFKNIAAQVASVGKAFTEIVERPEISIELPNDFLEMQTVIQKVQNDILYSRKTEHEAVQRKNDLVMYLAHDLKTPLTSVLGYLSLLRDEAEISPQNRQKYLNIVTDKAMRLDNLINDFFEITHFNLNEIILEKSCFDFCRLVEQVTDEFRPLLSAKSISLEVEKVSGAKLFADANKLERVLDNLIRNAISYSYDNSVIRISVIKKEDGHAPVFTYSRRR